MPDLDWNPEVDYYLVEPGPRGMVRVLTIKGQYSVTTEGGVRLSGHVLAEQDMTIEAARSFTMFPGKRK